MRVAWISGMPRSGTTWLSQILASSPNVRLKSCPLFSYEFKNALDETSTAEQWLMLFKKLYETNSEFLDQEHLRKHGLVPVFEEKNEHPENLIIKSNRFHNLSPSILRLNEHVKFIHIVRHPCASVYSWLNDPREFPDGANPLTEWRTGNCRKTGTGEFWGFDDWKHVTEQALSLTEQYPDRHKLVRYESLVKNTELETRAIFDFLQITFTKQTDDFIKLSHSRHDDHKHSVYKNPALKSNWEENLNPLIIKEILYELIGSELEQFTAMQ